MAVPLTGEQLAAISAQVSADVGLVYKDEIDRLKAKIADTENQLNILRQFASKRERSIMELKAFDKIGTFSGNQYLVWAKKMRGIIKLAHPKVSDDLLNSIEKSDKPITEGSLISVSNYDPEYLNEVCTDMFTPMQHVLDGEPHYFGELHFWNGSLAASSQSM